MKKIKKHSKTFIEIIRFRNCFMTFVGVLLGASFVDSGAVFSMNVLFAGVAAFLITGAGNIINDYFDYEIDRINKPKRAIPSNRIRRSDAMMLSIVMFLVGVGLAKYVNTYTMILALMNSVVLVVYGKYSKQLYFVSNLVVSYLVASIFIFGSLASIGDGFLFSEKMQLSLLVSGCAFFATLAREIIKDVEDIEGDRRKYAVTLPIKIGITKAGNIATFSLAIAIMLSLFPFFFYTGYLNIIAYGFLILIADGVFVVALKTPPAISQKLMIAGMGIAITAFFAGEVLALF